MHCQLALISQNLGWRCSVQNYVKYSFIKGYQCSFQAAVATAVSQTATVKMVVRGESGNRVCVSFCMTARDECVCVYSTASRN